LNECTRISPPISPCLIPLMKKQSQRCSVSAKSYEVSSNVIKNQSSHKNDEKIELLNENCLNSQKNKDANCSRDKYIDANGSRELSITA